MVGVGRIVPGVRTYVSVPAGLSHYAPGPLSALFCPGHSAMDWSPWPLLAMFWGHNSTGYSSTLPPSARRWWLVSSSALSSGCSGVASGERLRRSLRKKSTNRRGEASGQKLWGTVSSMSSQMLRPYTGSTRPRGEASGQNRSSPIQKSFKFPQGHTRPG